MTMVAQRSNVAQLQGLLVVHKPGLAELSKQQVADSGERPVRLPTSHDIVNRVRRWSGEKRIGHTGTLDPMASGVLVLTVGNATRLTEYHQDHDKHYIAGLKLGEATDTYDCTGKVTKTADVPSLDPAQIEAALSQFRGKIMQVPPAYSAIKQDGKTAYQQARKGKEISLAPRPITIYQLDLLDFSPPAQIQLDVRCSTGTYIRSLAHDLGVALGTVATLTYLQRIAVGPFTIEEAHTLEEIEGKANAGELAEWLLPTNFGLLASTIQLDETLMRRLGFGQQVKISNHYFTPLSDDATRVPVKDTLAQALGPDGELCGMIRCVYTNHENKSEAVWRADKWFVDSQLL